MILNSILSQGRFFIVALFLTSCSCSRRRDYLLNREDLDDNDKYYTNLRKPYREVRYLIFPKGSTFSIALCTQIKALTPDSNIFTEAVNWAISYELPTTEDIPDAHHKPVAVLVRRRRSSLYSKLEQLLYNLGIDGRSCILRTLCEVGRQEISHGDFIGELLQIIFTFPREHISTEEPKENWQYIGAHSAGKKQFQCQLLFPACPLSILATFLNLELER